MPRLLDFFYLPSYGSQFRKRYKLWILLVYLEGVLEVGLPGRRGMNSLREGFP